VNKNEVIQKLLEIYGSEELEQIREIASEISEEAIRPLNDIRKSHNGPSGANGIPAPGEYMKETKTIVLYENTFNPKVLIHEIGHSIYHELLDIAEIADSEYEEDFFSDVETTGEGLSWEKGTAEFCANAYQLYKTETISTNEDPERFRSLAEKLKERGL
jgi:hypothetical protein